jgi:pimeloyl-ACP methyl ester carboxylesterase
MNAQVNMAFILINGSDHYYEVAGKGQPIVFLHGAFGDARTWDDQWEYFSSHYTVYRYDLRGHGRTGASALELYDLTTFSDDLSSFLQALDILSPVLCGQSFGGSVVQAFTAGHPDIPRGIILSGSMVAVDLTFLDKLLARVIFPEWAMKSTIKALGLENYVNFTQWLGRLVEGKHFLGEDNILDGYLKECMLQIDRQEYLKLWHTMFTFHEQPLEQISCPVLIMNGEKEPANQFRHTKELLRCIPHARAVVIPGCSHVSNMENPQIFNQMAAEFLNSIA